MTAVLQKAGDTSEQNPCRQDRLSKEDAWEIA